jgi:hypothetical protein
VAWGDNLYGGCDVPAPNEDFIAVAGGRWRYSLGLKSDGAIVAWGYNHFGQCDVPSPNEGFIAVAGGGNHSLGLKSPSTTGIVDPVRYAPVAASFAIRSVSPNPFNPSAEIFFETSISSSLTLEIYDVAGRRINAVALGSFEPGVYRVRWNGQGVDGADVGSGIYFLRLRGTMGVSRAVKAILLR